MPATAVWDHCCQYLDHQPSMGVFQGIGQALLPSGHFKEGNCCLIPPVFGERGQREVSGGGDVRLRDL